MAKRLPPKPDLGRINIMAAGHITNTNAGLIRFCQYPQLSLLRPSPPTLNAGNDFHPRHANLFDLILMSALMLVLMPDYRLSPSISKISSPDAHLFAAESIRANIDQRDARRSRCDKFEDMFTRSSFTLA
ncbi:hypothetical protein [Rhizobium rhizogenes]